MNEHQNSNEMLQQLRVSFQKSLQEFASKSTSTFQVLRSIPANKSSPSIKTVQGTTQTLYVLDASFNPPSRAHLTIAQEAFSNDTKASPTSPKRILFLLATENADKKPKPAPFEDRLVMMTLMAQDLHSKLTQKAHSSTATTGQADSTSDLVIDIGVTKKPFFMDKASAVDESKYYDSNTQQVHLTGYDTLIRIFDAKYYPSDKKLRVLEPFLDRHRLRVSYRVGDSYAGRKEQEKYVDGIGDGSREDEGMKREWKEKVELVDDVKGDLETVSSTKARKAAQDGNWEDLRFLVGDEVAEYVRAMNLYQGEGFEKTL